jgi:sec-independent protein translocase protein TatC
MIVLAFFIGAVLTPPDIVSQFMLGVPLILLFEISLAIMWFTEHRAKVTEQP